jgi:hypothetical protein
VAHRPSYLDAGAVADNSSACVWPGPQNLWVRALKQGRGHARACWWKQPGRRREGLARRGQVAAVATARKLTIVIWPVPR